MLFVQKFLQVHHSAIGYAGIAVALILTSFSANLIGQSPNAGYHVTICHRTGSASNPYIIISPNVEGVIEGHMDHEQTGNGLGGDIIPEFSFLGTIYSKNLGTNFGDGITGARLLANGCNVPKTNTPTPTPTPPGPTPTPPAPVPEPVTMVLFGTGLAAVGMAARRRFGKKDIEKEEESN